MDGYEISALIVLFIVVFGALSIGLGLNKTAEAIEDSHDDE